MNKNSSWNRELQTLLRRPGWQAVRLSRIDAHYAPDVSVRCLLASSTGSELRALTLEPVWLRYPFCDRHNSGTEMSNTMSISSAPHTDAPRENGQSTPLRPRPISTSLFDSTERMQLLYARILRVCHLDQPFRSAS